MKIQLFLAAILLAAPAFAHAADPGAPSPPAVGRPSSLEAAGLAGLNKQIDDMKVVFAKTQQCFTLETELRSDLTAKKAELNSEFKGAIPLAFNDMLWQKATRVDKQHKECAVQYDELGKNFELLEHAFQTIYPPSLNIKKQRALVAETKEKFFSMQPTAKPRTRTTAAKKPAN
jgi:hypothetical protein